MRNALHHMVGRLCFARLATAVILLTMCSLDLQAQVVTVTNTADSGPGSFRDAVSLASPGTVIQFDPALYGSTIFISGNAVLNTVPVTIEGPGNNDITIVSTNSLRRTLTLTADCTIEGLTFENSQVQVGPTGVSDGGAVIGVAPGANVTIDNCRFDGNLVQSNIPGEISSGGVFYNNGNLTIKNSTLVSNDADHAAGGLARGAAIANAGRLTIDSSYIGFNYINGANDCEGAAIYSTGPMHMSASTLETNWCVNNNPNGGTGGGIYATDTVIIETSAITNNRAYSSGSGTFGQGGAIAYFGYVHVDRSSVYSNSTLPSTGGAARGGAFYGGSSSSQLLVTRSTLTSNTVWDTDGGASIEGALIYDCCSTPITLSGNIISNNRLIDGPTQTEAVSNAPMISGGYNLVRISDNLVATTGDLLGTVGDPIDPQFDGFAADNGGATKTFALQSCSPAIDGGDPTDNDPDQRGVNVLGAAREIGSFETSLTFGDSLAPIFTCPDDKVLTNTFGSTCEYILPDFTTDPEISVSDDCTASEDMFITQSPAPGTVYAGSSSVSITITLTAADETGNTASCSFNLSVEDTEAPVLVCQDYTLTLDLSGFGMITPENVDGGSSDNCGDLNLAVTPNTFSFDDEGPNTVTLSTAGDILANTLQDLGLNKSENVTLGDLDGDGDLDAFISNDGANQVWLNDGSGTFTNSGQDLGNSDSRGTGLGDFDGDGDLDAYVANYGPNFIWLNDGIGNFTVTGDSLDDRSSNDAQVGDLDNDGDLDVFVSNGWSGTELDRSLAWLNDGSANFTQVGVVGGYSPNRYMGASLGDVDGDGDLDAFVATFSSSSALYINDGAASFGLFDVVFYSIGEIGYDAALGDYDNDGDLDVVFAALGDNKLWVNDGVGNFSNSGQVLGSGISNGISAADFDMDGDLDVIFANSGSDEIWLNDGSGGFDTAIQIMPGTFSYNVAVGNLDGDIYPDVFMANRGDFTGPEPNNVWLSQYRSCDATVTVEASCSPSTPPQNLTHSFVGSGVLLEWDAIPNSVACQVQGTRISPPGPSGSQIISGFEPSSSFIPTAVLGAGTSWDWRVRCACSTSPVIATPFSELDTFNVPVLARVAALERTAELFPNPVSDLLTVDLMGYENELLTIRVLNVNGATALEQSARISANWENLELDVSTLPSGYYTLSILTESEVEMIPFVKGESR